MASVAVAILVLWLWKSTAEKPDSPTASSSMASTSTADGPVADDPAADDPAADGLAADGLAADGPAALSATGARAAETASASAGATEVTGGGNSVVPLPQATAFDYQLGGSYDLPAGVGIVVRDRTASPAEGAYSICYINAFQTQPEEQGLWPQDAILMEDGVPVIDPEWPDELLLDTSTAQKREVIASLVTPWITNCAQRGFKAVEFDNLDSFTRSQGALSLDNNLELAKTLVTAAHKNGLVAGQKNAAEYTEQLKENAGFDFAVAEECAANEECASYSDSYGSAVLDIEYTDNLPTSFDTMCADANATASSPMEMILRDRQLVTPDSSHYVYETCATQF